MLKKAGIAVAAATAGLLAVSPLAFASGNADHHEQDGLVNVQDNVLQGNVCDNNVNVLGIQVTDITGALGLLNEENSDTTAQDNDECENESSN